MTSEQRLELNTLAYDSPILYKLLQLRDHAHEMSDEDWAHYAIVHLTRSCKILLEAAVDAARRAPPRPIL